MRFFFDVVHRLIDSLPSIAGFCDEFPSGVVTWWGKPREIWLGARGHVGSFFPLPRAAVHVGYAL